MRWELEGKRLVLAGTRWHVEQDADNSIVWHAMKDGRRGRFFNGLIEALEHAEEEAQLDWLASQKGIER